MADGRIDIYAAADRAIKEMDRDNLREFGKLKLAKFDEINVIRTVSALYRRQAKKAEKRYYEVAFEAYLLAMAMCGIDPMEAAEMAEKAITEKWVAEILNQTDFVTMYRFRTETERKAQRLTEAISAASEGRDELNTPATNRNREIDKALRYWTGQLAQYALNVTDYAVVQAFEDAGVDGAFWIAQKDQRVCTECHALDGRWFRLSEIPRKPHWGCRCILRPGRNPEE